MERKIIKRLVEWYQQPRRAPLLLSGARQVGKTYIALEFGRRHFSNTVYLNFEDARELAAIFDRDFDTERILKELSAFTRESIVPQKTLLIFDEIQACERAMTSLKYFCEKAPEYCILAAGSPLGVAINRSSYSFPVGKVDMLTMYPLDFEEFLLALGEDKMLGLIRDSYASFTPLSLHEQALSLYQQYLVVGGMPRAVQEYVDTKDFLRVFTVQKTLNDSYIADMAKYASPSKTSRTMAAWASLPAQLAKKNKKFQYQVIGSGARAYNYAPSIDWLRAAGMINKCILTREGRLPLSAFTDPTAFKLYMVDTGLLCSKFGIPANAVLSASHDLDAFKGALAENYVMQALTANGLEPYYWTSGAQAELDFVFQNAAGQIIPLEVKAANNVRARSLGIFSEKYAVPYAYRVSARNFGCEGSLRSVPLYAVFCIAG